jgi:hypothetical protein
MNVNSIPTVWDFPEVFLEGIESLPLEREVEFSIELISGVGTVSKVLYLMSSLELAKVKQQEFLLKKFIWPSALGKEEEWKTPPLCGLPRVEQAHSEEQVPVAAN